MSKLAGVEKLDTHSNEIKEKERGGRQRRRERERKREGERERERGREERGKKGIKLRVHLHTKKPFFPRNFKSFKVNYAFGIFSAHFQ